MVAPNPLFLRDADLDRSLALLLDVERELGVRAAQALDRAGLAATDFRILHLAVARGGLTLADLARALGLTKQTLSRQVARLLEGGQLEREPAAGDRRKLRLTPTPAARQAVEEVLAQHRRQLRLAFKKAGPVAVEGFGRVLAELAEETGRRERARDAA